MVRNAKIININLGAILRVAQDVKQWTNNNYNFNIHCSIEGNIAINFISNLSIANIG